MNPTNLKTLCQQVFALWKFAIRSRETTVSEISLLRQFVESQADIIGLLMDVCEKRFTEDEQALQKIRGLISDHEKWAADFKRFSERERFILDQAQAMIAEMDPMIERLPEGD